MDNHDFKNRSDENEDGWYVNDGDRVSSSARKKGGKHDSTRESVHSSTESESKEVNDDIF